MDTTLRRVSSNPARANEWGQPVGETVCTSLPSQRPPHTKLQGRYCTLEPLDPSVHGASLYQAFGREPDARGWTYLPYGPFEDFSAFERWLQSVAKEAELDFYSVVDTSAGAALGLCSYLRIEPNLGSLEIGHVRFAQQLQRTTAATEAMYLLLRRAFESGYRRCEWKCDALNAPSRAAAKRLGFIHEGLFRQALVYKGRNRDTAWFSIIDTDWPERKAQLEAWLDPVNFDVRGLQRSRLRPRQ